MDASSGQLHSGWLALPESNVTKPACSIPAGDATSTESWGTEYFEARHDAEAFLADLGGATSAAPARLGELFG
ncbi:MAG: hypothetical protein DRJ42_28975 [Deltaproteobacteria bacterium]|nr:MAG: hypothetical protein DRJ42_28975 [Deltaproteobacteria bacterium]